MADPTVSQGTRGRLSYAQKSATNIGLENTQYDEIISLEMRHKNPLNRLIMKMNREVSNTIDVHDFADQYVPHRDPVFYSTGYNSSATAITVTHGEYFAIGDLVRHENSDEVMLVTGVSSDVVTMTRDFGQATEGWSAKAASITDGDYLEILGNAFEAGHPIPVYKHTITEESINYCQDVRTPVIMTEISEDTDLRTQQNDLAYQEAKAAEDHFWKIERNTLWGKPYRGDSGVYASGTGNTAPAAAAGINHQLEVGCDADHLVDQTDLTEWEFLDWLEVAFDKGSDNKLLICSPNLRTAFDKWGISRQQTFDTTTVAGIAVDKWRTSHGKDLYILTHDLLKRYLSTQYYYNFILDMKELTYFTFGRSGAMRYRKAGSHETNGQTLTSWEYQTISCAVVKQPNYHSRMRYKTYSI